jgi:hypothetical protein
MRTFWDEFDIQMRSIAIDVFRLTQERKNESMKKEKGQTPEKMANILVPISPMTQSGIANDIIMSTLKQGLTSFKDKFLNSPIFMTNEEKFERELKLLTSSLGILPTNSMQSLQLELNKSPLNQLFESVRNQFATVTSIEAANSRKSLPGYYDVLLQSKRLLRTVVINIVQRRLLVAIEL